MLALEHGEAAVERRVALTAVRGSSVHTIAEYDRGRDNNYQLIRLVAASMVVFAHSFFLSTSGTSEPLRAFTGYKHFGELGIQVFFVISGYLVTKSFLARGDLASYLEARVLRIFPALIVAIAFAVIVIGPMATTLPTSEYFAREETRSYFLNNVTLVREVYELPGVFAGTPYPKTVNGSLWSLFTEIRMYLLVALLGTLGLFAPRRRFDAALVLCVLLCVYFPEVSQFLRHLFNSIFVDFRLPIYFAFGTICFVNRDHVPVHWLLLVGLALLALVLHATSLFPIAFDLAVCYGVLFCAYVPSPSWIRGFNRIGDYSYGLFIYAFPVQQLIATRNPTITALPMLALSFAFTLPLAMLSWHVIEKPCLAAKGKLSRKLAGDAGG
jgi:peptidoglycan/LPS O-acetylase OafA/YrhL